MVSDTLKARIQDTIEAALARPYRRDPVIPRDISRTQSAIGSAVKRHGSVIQLAVIEQLRRSPHHVVIDCQEFPITHQADRLAEDRAYETCLQTSLPYRPEDRIRVIAPDALVLDLRARMVSAYEIKRGAGALDAGKKRSTERDLLCLAMLAPSIVEALGYSVVRPGRAFLISYYGVVSVHPCLSLTGNDLDRHFGVPIQGYLAEVNHLYRRHLMDSLNYFYAGFAQRRSPATPWGPPPRLLPVENERAAAPAQAPAAPLQAPGLPAP